VVHSLPRLFPWTHTRLSSLGLVRKTTAKGQTVYLHVFNWPWKPQLDLPWLGAAVRQITLLATGRKVQFQQTKGRLTIAVPPRAPDPDDSVFAIDTRWNHGPRSGSVPIAVLRPPFS
jgi:hypothetical protein